MIKTLLKFFYLFSFSIYIFFVIANYFSEDNISFIEKKVFKNAILDDEKFNIPTLQNNTQNVIIYSSEDLIETERKKRKIWELLDWFMKRKPIIISLSSFKLTKNEKSLIYNHKPWGIILFKRNIKSFSQVKLLTSSIRKLMHDPFYPILIDEEGGRVSRLSKIIDTSNFNLNSFGKLYEKNRLKGINSYIEYLSFISGVLTEVGININTIPVLDILKKNTHNVIGNRRFSGNTRTINC